MVSGGGEKGPDPTGPGSVAADNSGLEPFAPCSLGGPQTGPVSSGPPTSSAPVAGLEEGRLSRRRLLRLGTMAGLAGLASACGARRQSVGPATSGKAVPPPTMAKPSTTAERATTVAPATTAGTAPTTTAPTTTAPTTTTPTTTAATTTAPITTVPSTSTTAVAVTEADWKALAGGLSGRLSRPGSPGYPVDLELYDPRFDGTHPAAIAFCASSSDVARSITFAREHGLALAARSGGHSYGGYSTSRGLVVDVSRMSIVTVTGGVATIGAGAELIDVYSGLAQVGVSIPAGSCPTVGIAGLALGGGIGVMDRLHGATCDNVVGLTLVTAAGDVVRANAATNPDLYWACRGGGGGNFGVVTEFRFATFPVMDISLFSATWPWSAAATLVPAWMRWSSSAPDELWSNCLLEAYPGAATPQVRVGGSWAGSAADAQAQLSKLVNAWWAPSSQSVGENGFEDAMYIEAGCRGLSEAACHLAGKYPGGTLPRMVSLAKSDIFNAPAKCRGRARPAGGRRGTPEPGRSRWRRPGLLGWCHQPGGAGRNRLRAPAGAGLSPVRGRLSRRCGHRLREGGRPLDEQLVCLPAAIRQRRGVPELHRPRPARLGTCLLRGQPSPPPEGQGQVGPRWRMAVRPEHPGTVALVPPLALYWPH